ncbi:MAG: transglutaminase domain-containing protein [Thermodesulfobacteriota bacterium]|nr:transglutaminase domain-containing protein [Thermodesulfobacteriota bacterium]
MAKVRIKLFIVALSVLLFIFNVSNAQERRTEVTLKINLRAPEDSKDVRLWIPYPVSDENQTVEDVRIDGNFSSHGVYKEKEFGNSILYAEWKNPVRDRSLTYIFKVKRREVVKRDFPKDETFVNKKEFERYLMATSLSPIGGKVKEIAENITKGKKTTLAKARAIYDWIVDNMYRDPQIKGCGIGDVERLLESLGGKCGDIHSVYVALARSVGVPAREIFGIRIPKGKEGDMTKAQHCWAEFYLPGYGWVPVDPSDVRKIMLEKKLNLGEERDYREYYFGAVDENRIAYGMGRNLILNPPQRDGNLNYFMYPYAEADGKALDDLFGFNLGYTITFKEL